MNTAAQPILPAHRYRFSNQAEAGQVLDIFNEIDEWYGIGLPALAYELSKLNSSQPLTVRIHSPGGSVTDGLGIRNLLRAYPGELTTVGVGFVASIASVILLAGKRVKMADNAYLMIHRPYGGVMGNADEMRQTADVLSSMDNNLLDIYMEAVQSRGNSDLTREQVFEMMKKETWMTAREALALGFIDEVITAQELPVSASAFQALALFKHTPEGILFNENTDEMNLIEQIRALLVQDTPTPETVAPVAEAVVEVAAPAVDPIEAARLLLEQSGYTVATPTPPATQEEDETIAIAFAQLQSEIKALRTEVAKAKATPSGGATTDKPAGQAAKTQREKVLDAFAQFTKTKILTR